MPRASCAPFECIELARLIQTLDVPFYTTVAPTPGKSHLGLTDNLAINTNTFHDAAGIHAADGALPVILACVDPAACANDWYTTDGPKATDLKMAAHVQDPRDPDPDREAGLQTKPSADPLNEEIWPRELRESAWAQCEKAAGTEWVKALL